MKLKVIVLIVMCAFFSRVKSQENTTYFFMGNVFSINANDEKNPMESFPNFQYSVSPQWVNSVLKGEKPETYTNDKFMLFEVSWGPLEKSKGYAQHITGAYHFDTDWIENGPVWNLSDPKVIEANLLKNGITKDKTIIVTFADGRSETLNLNATEVIPLEIDYLGMPDNK